MMIDMPNWVIRAETGGNLSIQGVGDGAPLRRKYYTQKERLTLPFGRELPPILDDLVDLAHTVYVADRLLRRSQTGRVRHNWSWQRRLEVQLPVSDPERWNDSSVVSALSEALSFLTEDRWDFCFYPRDQRRIDRSLQYVLFPPEPPIVGALFSGGLDSLAGLALHLSDSNFRSMAILTIASNSRLLCRQRELLQALHRRTTTRLLSVIVPIRLNQHSRDYNLNERSQRGRGFLFNILGSVSAMMAGANELHLFENGVGSINLPLSEAQLGAQSSRATNPVALLKIERFLHALGFEFRLRLPFLFLTKGEMCNRLQASPFNDLAVRSVSCDGFPPRLSGAEHCGVCTSCLLRRQALWSSGYVEDRHGGQYRHDVLGLLEAIPTAKLAPFWDMLTQVNKLGQALWSPRPWQELTIEYPELQEVLDVVTEWFEPSARLNIQQNLIALYRTYCKEWQLFPANPLGWSFSFPDFRLIA